MILIRYKNKRKEGVINNLTHQTLQAYNMVSDKGAVVINNEKTVKLTANQERDFIKAFKIGILKELYKKQLLTDEQLKKLIEMQK